MRSRFESRRDWFASAARRVFETLSCRVRTRTTTMSCGPFASGSVEPGVPHPHQSRRHKRAGRDSSSVCRRRRPCRGKHRPRASDLACLDPSMPTPCRARARGQAPPVVDFLATLTLSPVSRARSRSRSSDEPGLAAKSLEVGARGPDHTTGWPPAPPNARRVRFLTPAVSG